MPAWGAQTLAAAWHEIETWRMDAESVNGCRATAYVAVAPRVPAVGARRRRAAARIRPGRRPGAMESSRDRARRYTACGADERAAAALPSFLHAVALREEALRPSYQLSEVKKSMRFLFF